jgi:hypothetical protein
MDPLVDSIRIDRNICLIADFHYYRDGDNLTNIEQLDHMQEICEAFSKYSPHYLSDTFELIPMEYRSYNVYLNTFYNCYNLVIIKRLSKQIPDDMKDCKMFVAFMHHLRSAYGEFIVVGQDEYDELIKSVPEHLRDQIYVEYKDFLYSTKEKGIQIAKKYYEELKRTQ